jgi:signal transduction histidine kinase/CheY-like chemotaxis protein
MKIEILLAFLSGIAATAAVIFLIKSGNTEQEAGKKEDKKTTPLTPQDKTYNSSHAKYLERAKEIAIKAELASEAKSRFIAYMTHEIRTTLNIIMGVSQIFIEDKEEISERQRGLLSSVSDASKKLLSVVDDVSEFSTRERSSRHFFIKQKNLDIKKMCTEIINEENSVAQNKNLQLLFALTNEIPAAVVGDRTKLSHLIYTLIENAIRFTNDGSVKLTVENLSPSSKDKTNLLFLVEDSGIGISEEKVNAIFDFSDEDVVTAERTGNVKLGLAICKYLTESMGGSISVESKKNQGTSFSITLPFQIASAPERTMESFAMCTAIKTGVNFSGKKALLAEDDHINRQIEKILLQKYGFDVDTASNGQEALEKSQKNKYDVIFMDCEMPVMNGFTATREIRKVEKASNKPPIPIIAMTANAMAGDKEMCVEAGMSDYVSKPVDINKLVGVISQYIPPK